MDRTRNTILFDGGAYDTYASSDDGKTWRSIFDMKMFHLDASTRWCIDHKGRWYYEGRVYGKFPVNLVSEDGGETIRYLMMDSNEIGIRNQFYERSPILIQPETLVFDFTMRRDSTNGIYATSDAGRSFIKMQHQSNILSTMFLKPVKERTLALVDSSNNTLEVDVTSGEMTQTDIPAVMSYVRLSDGTVVQISSTRIRIRKPEDSTFTEYAEIIEPTTGRARAMTTRSIELINDTLAVIFGGRAETMIVSPNLGLRVLNAPVNRVRYQQIIQAGYYRDLLLTVAIIPEGTTSGRQEITVYNVKTGKVDVYQRTGYANVDPNMDPSRSFAIIPISETEWLSSFSRGEFVRTTNAGKTWMMMDDIEQNEQWGEAWVGLSRLFPRGDGSVAVMTNRGRLMSNVDNNNKWEVIIPDLFSHKVQLPSGATSLFTRTNIAYTEDFAGSYRHRYGPSTVLYPNPDELWVSGDVVTRFTSRGEFMDTVLPRKARFLKRLSERVTVAAMDSVYFSFNEGKEWVYVGFGMPRRIYDRDTVRGALGDIVLAQNGDIIAGFRGITVYNADRTVYDSIPGGLMVSTNNGNTWRSTGPEVDDGLYITGLHRTSSGALLCIASEVVIDPWYIDLNGEPARLSMIEENMYKLNRSFIYRSTDHGRSWQQVFSFPDRAKLGSTDLRFSAMPDGRVMVIHPSYGVIITANDGRTWSIGDPLSIGNPLINDVVFTEDGYAHFATSEGYARLKIDNIVSVNEQRSYQHGEHVVLIRDSRLSVPTLTSPNTIQIYSLQGELLSTTTNVTSDVVVDLQLLSHGAYLMVASDESSMWSTLFVK